MQVNDPVAPKNINRASCASSNHAPPAEGEQRLERHDGSAIYSPLTLLYKRKKKKSVKSLLFLTQKGTEECLKFREDWRVWNLSPRGQTGGFFSFQAFIDSPLSSLATQKDTWKNFWWGCDVRKKGDLLCWCSLLILNEHISPSSVSTVGHLNFSSSCILERTLKRSFLGSSKPPL